MKRRQRYPFIGEIEISSNIGCITNPIIVFAGKADLEENTKRVTITIFRKKRLSSEKLIEKSITIQLANDEPVLDKKVIENQIVSCDLKVISYRLGKELIP